MSTVTWGQIAQGDTIRALDGSEWHVEYIITDYNWMRTLAGIHNSEQRIEVTYAATDPVERVETVQQAFDAGELSTTNIRVELPDPELETAQQVLEAADTGPEMIAEEATDEQQQREAATQENVLPLPEILSPLTLRSHLYLVHGLSVSELPAGPEAGPMMQRLHATSHETGPMINPHYHDPKLEPK